MSKPLRLRHEQVFEKSTITFTVVAAVLLLSMFYGVAYAIALKKPVLPRPDGSACLFSPPEYRVGGRTAAAFFYPVHFVDAHYVRPKKWVILETVGD